MKHPPGIIFEAACGALARHHTHVGLRAPEPSDKQFHMARAEAFLMGGKLPPSRLPMLLFLSTRWPHQFSKLVPGLEARGRGPARFFPPREKELASE